MAGDREGLRKEGGREGGRVRGREGGREGSDGGKWQRKGQAIKLVWVEQHQ